MPVWAWLVALVAVSALVRYAFGRRIVAPWIMVDELIYAELAKSLAATGELRIREEPYSGAFGVLYPLLLAPAYLVHEAVPAAYALAKAINGALFSLAAVPTYLLARRLVGPWPALAAAALAVLVPGSLYAGMLMTENVFYPLVVTVALALVLALERPTPLRAGLVVAAIAVAFLARAQAVVFVPVVLVAPLLLVAFERSWTRGLARFRWLYAAVTAPVAALVLVQLARGRSPLDLLGAYRVAGEQTYDPATVARWALYHVAALDLSLGILPFAALLLLLGLAPRLGAREQAFLAVTATLAVFLVLQVAAFASRFADRVEERNMFHLAPLFLVALVLWVSRGLPRPRALAAGAALVAALLPLVLPFERLVNVTATSDTFGLLLWWDVWEWGVPLDRLWLPVLALCLALAALFLLLPARLAPVLLVVTAAFFLVSTYSVEHRIRSASVGHLFQGITHPHRDWVDRAVGADAQVAALWTVRRDWQTVLQNEFFSRSVGPVYTLDDPFPTGLPQTPLETDRETGRLLADGRDPVEAEYVLVDDQIPVAGEVVEADRVKNMVLVRPERPLRLEHTTTGLYPDGWSQPTFTYRRYECEGGSVRVRLQQDPSLVASAQRVVARTREAQVGAATVGRLDREATLVARLLPLADGTCEVELTVAPTAVPADVQHGSDDTRRLGIRVLGFDHRP